MLGNPMNIPPISIAAAKAALIEQYADVTLRRRATMLWGTRGVGKSSIVRQVPCSSFQLAGRQAAVFRLRATQAQAAAPVFGVA